MHFIAVMNIGGKTQSYSLFRKYIKKLKRKSIRQAKARQRDEEESERLQRQQASPSYASQQSELLAQQQLEEENEARESVRLHNQWLQREVIAQQEFQRKQERDEKIRLAKEKQARTIQEEWEMIRKKEKEESDAQEKLLLAKKEKEAALLKDATEMLGQDNGPWQNPSAPHNYTTEQEKQNCPFFLKTGACRFGDRCSRGHPKPNLTRTLLIPGMFSHFSIDQSLRDEFDSDISLEYEDSEFYQHFRDFYDDVLPEFKSIGRVVQFKVCRNFEPHLRGNVYIQFEREEDAWEAFQKFNGRYYAGKQLSCEFSLVTKWKAAICGLYHRNRCPKGKACNFLHVFKNPNREFYEADQDYSPSRSADRSNSHSLRSYRSSSRNSHRSPQSHRSRRRSHSRDYHRSSSRHRRHRRRSDSDASSSSSDSSRKRHSSNRSKKKRKRHRD